MPTRRLIPSILRQWINSALAYPSSTPQKWDHPLRLSQGFDTRAFHSLAASLATQNANAERRLELNQDDDGEPPLAQREPSLSHSLQQRLRDPKRPKRRKDYEANNVIPKHDKNKIASEGASEQTFDQSLSKGKPVWRAMQTSELEVQLQRVAHHFPSVRRVHNLLRVLIVHRSVKPTVSHYEALILANCDAELGSVKAVKAVLQEMERENIAIGMSIYEAVLKVTLPYFSLSI